MLKAAARPLGVCRSRASPRGEALLKCFIAETIRLAGTGNSCFWTHVPCLFNMEKSGSLWDIPCGSLPGSKNRELMSFGDSNWKHKNRQAQSLANILMCILKCFLEHWGFLRQGMGWEGAERCSLAGFLNVLMTRSQPKDVTRIPSFPFPFPVSPSFFPFSSSSYSFPFPFPSR